jgi:hypothetical protein
MRVPDYGRGDWSVKERRNRELPAIESIGVREGDIYISLTDVADCIKFLGTNHRTLHLVTNSSAASMALGVDEPYARITAYFPDGEVIYTNPFARYDASQYDMPQQNDQHSVNILYTLLFNLALLLLVVGVALAYIKLLKLLR